ncbi:protein phosphatase inhibitor 2-like [Callospermophilus lateralis]|uniref:protein phosphatase inhibitor 2-like n=1 Tax=Callospermophilus lateralis TaxID=76772 RepID=UPI0040388E68
MECSDVVAPPHQALLSAVLLLSDWHIRGDFRRLLTPAQATGSWVHPLFASNNNSGLVGTVAASISALAAFEWNVNPTPAATLSRHPERPAIVASTASHPPIKGILKNKTSATSSVVSSVEQPHRSVEEELSKKSQKWDEMNILATYHPAGKDYGLMKIDEPSTPYHSMMSDDEDAYSDTETTEAMTPDVLAKKLTAVEGSEPKYRTREKKSRVEEKNDFSLEEREKKRQFELRRKLHYNEGLNIKLARQLIAKDLHDDEDEMLEADTEQSKQGSTTSGQQQNKSQNL